MRCSPHEISLAILDLDLDLDLDAEGYLGAHPCSFRRAYGQGDRRPPNRVRVRVTVRVRGDRQPLKGL